VRFGREGVKVNSGLSDGGIATQTRTLPHAKEETIRRGGGSGRQWLRKGVNLRFMTRTAQEPSGAAAIDVQTGDEPHESGGSVTG
jgi:hypothetical protein